MLEEMLVKITQSHKFISEKETEQKTMLVYAMGFFLVFFFCFFVVLVFFISVVISSFSFGIDMCKLFGHVSCFN